MKTLLFLLLLVNSLFGFEYWQYVDKHYKFTTQKELQKKYKTVISPYFQSHKLHFFSTPENIKIAYKIFKVKHAKAVIVISSGRSEGMVKYQELIYDLNRNGYSVYILDHRGQGYSQRLLPDTKIGYVESFFHYVDDLKFFVENYVPKDKKRVLLGHSMGGTIASLYAEVYPHDFSALILYSPMHQPNLILPVMSTLLCDLMEKKKRNLSNYIVGTASYDITKQNFDENDLTHSKIRYEIMQQAYRDEPQTKIGGPSVKWVQEACKWSKIAVENASLIQIPTLLLQGEKDQVVNADAQEEFCKNAHSHCHGYTIKGAYHELYIEKDGMRQKALSAILDFISKI
ncbi:alpha/beta fold hydrolase [Sulfurimonas paralvinellae]|uniref:Alpha/beta fold hydrolase n=1 Tax=Sulfurimonas paralvinellae TaxID=317658 RepID=A0A7M1B5J0_9BACT|nr:alpha/beta fold hydrolase [Sulfurimonas paralvinellae]QOP44981.1 alpha/beta fold hydrolase [Sulfurimonas paralvinellae]